MARFVEIDFLEAGQKSSGDAITLRYRDDNDVDHIHVVDGGYTDDGDRLVDHIRKHYDSATSIDHVVLTHPDGDHAAGLKKVLDEFDVGTVRRQINPDQWVCFVRETSCRVTVLRGVHRFSRLRCASVLRLTCSRRARIAGRRPA